VADRLRCFCCRSEFDSDSFEGYVVESAGGWSEGDHDPDFICSAQCLLSYAIEEGASPANDEQIERG
jgi:hypothetical protein